MTIFEFITKILNRASGEVTDLRAALIAAKTAKPDLAPLVDPILAALDAPVDVAGVATAVVPELGQIALLHFDGKAHPSDAF